MASPQDALPAIARKSPDDLARHHRINSSKPLKAGQTVDAKKLLSRLYSTNGAIPPTITAESMRSKGAHIAPTKQRKVTFPQQLPPITRDGEPLPRSGFRSPPPQPPALAATPRTLSAAQQRELFRLIENFEKHSESYEFSYLAPIRGVRFNPYRMRIVTHAEVDPENYFTISNNGVTHYFHGEIDITPLNVWVREYETFHRLLKIPIFSQYRMWKPFSVWRRNVTHKKMVACKEALAKNVFLLNPVLQVTLMRVHDACRNFAAKRLFRVDADATYTLKDFVRVQEDHMRQLRTEFAAFEAEVQLNVLDACKADVTAAGFTLEADISELTYIQQAELRAKYARIAHFIRLCDYLVFSAFRSLVIGSVTDLCALVACEVPKIVVVNEERKEVPRAPLFHVQIELHARQLRFSPGVGQFQWIMEKTFQSFLDFVAGIRNLVSLPMYEQFTRPRFVSSAGDESLADGPQLGPTAFDDDHKYQAAVAKTRDSVALAFERSAHYAASFSESLSVYLENTSLDLDKLMAAQTSPAFFGELLARFNGQCAMMQAMPETQQVLFLRVDTRGLKELFVPSPLGCFTHVRQGMPGLIASRTRALLQEINANLRQVSSIPSTVDEFLEHIRFLDALKGTVGALANQCAELEGMFALTQEYEISLNVEDYALFQTLQPTFVALKDAIAAADTIREERTGVFSEEVMRQVERLRLEALQTQQNLQNPMLASRDSGVETVLQFLGKIETALARFAERAGVLTSQQKELGLIASRHEELEHLRRDFDLKRTLWTSLSEWDSTLSAWLETPFLKLDIEAVGAELQRYRRVIQQSRAGLPGNNVVPLLDSKVSRFDDVFPVISDLRNPSLRARHWDEMCAVIGQDFWREGDVRLSEVLSLSIGRFREPVARISSKASSEGALEAMLNRVDAMWKETEFVVKPYRPDLKDMFVLTNVDEIYEKLDDSLVTIGAIRGSKHIGPIRGQVEEWNRLLRVFSGTLDLLLTCQQLWMRLEALFGIVDLQRQMPQEYRLFASADKSFREIMWRTNNKPNAMRAGTAFGLQDTLQHNITALEGAEKCVDEYLDARQQMFPRLYFLSRRQVLEVIGQSKNPLSVQSVVGSLFAGIEALDYSVQNKAYEFKGAVSSEGEVLAFAKTVKPRNTADVWLSGVEDAMVSSLKRTLKQSLLEFDGKTQPEMIGSLPGQAIALHSQIAWTRVVGYSIETGAPAEKFTSMLDECEDRIDALCDMVRDDPDALRRKTAASLLTLAVYQRDILGVLSQLPVPAEASTFEWHATLRYYWEPDENTAVVRIGDGTFKYGFEYLGACQRAAVTPLTQRCYLALATAMQHNVGVASAGPSGVGKTEMMRDMARALGRFCAVFNCSAGMDAGTAFRLFAGAGQSGCFSILDDADRSRPDVLSVIGQHIRSMKIAKDSGAASFSLNGRDVRLEPSAAVHLTMRSGAERRSKIPPNLRALMRPFEAVAPPQSFVGDVLLLCEGFDEPQRLARQLETMHGLLAERLSGTAAHYDWGLRALRAIVSLAGQRRRAWMETTEDEIVASSAYDVHFPRMLAEDAPALRAAVADAFPEARSLQSASVGLLSASLSASSSAARETFQMQQNYLHSEGDARALRQAITAAITAGGLQPVTRIVDTAVRLRMALDSLQPVAIVGLAGCGKTATWQTLARAMNVLRALPAREADRNLATRRLHSTSDGALTPSAAVSATGKPETPPPEQSVEAVWCAAVRAGVMTPSELFGERREGGQWADGVFPALFRQEAPEGTLERWIVIDGPVDADWSEQLNTLLDDTRTLCLPSGERLRMPDNMRILLETVDLSTASPSTVTRCRVVAMDRPQDYWMPMAQSRIARTAARLGYADDLVPDLQRLFATVIPAGLKYVRDSGEEPLPTQDLGIVESICTLLDAVAVVPKDAPLMQGEDVRRIVHGAFAFAFVWGVGGSFSDAARVSFDRFARVALDGLECNFPASGSVFDYHFNNREGTFVKWADLVPTGASSEAVPRSHDMLFTTPQTVCYDTLINYYVEQGRPVLLTGPPGTGKNQIAARYMQRRREKEGFLTGSVACHGRTTADHLRQYLEGSLVRRADGGLSPPPGRRMLMMLLDLNADADDEAERCGDGVCWGTQMELLAQIASQGGFHAKWTPTFRRLSGVSFIATCGSTESGRRAVPERLSRHVAVVCVPVPTQETFLWIANTALQGFLAPFADEVRAIRNQFASAIVALTQRIAGDFPPVPTRSHYIFSLREAARVLVGMTQMRPLEVFTKVDAVRVFAHECARVFHDRFVDPLERRRFNAAFAEIQESFFGASADKITAAGDLVFGAVAGFNGSTVKSPVYTELDVEKLSAFLQEKLDEYNVKCQQSVRLVFFPEITRTFVRIHRLLRQRRGSALLVGARGSWRSSLVRFAAYLASMAIVVVDASKWYGVEQLREDLRKAARAAGSLGVDIVLLCSESVLEEPSFLDDLNCMLGTGTIPNLFKASEREEIIAEVRQFAIEAGCPDTPDCVTAHFYERVKDRVHVAMCCSPGPLLARRLREYPAVQSRCSVVWVDGWTEESLAAIASVTIEGPLAADHLGGIDVAQKVVAVCTKAHGCVTRIASRYSDETGRQFHVTSAAYDDMLQLVAQLMEKRRTTISTGLARFGAAVDRVSALHQQLAKLHRDFGNVELQMTQQKADIEYYVTRLVDERKLHEDALAQISTDEAFASDLDAEIESLVRLTEEEIAAAVPALEGAIAGVLGIEEAAMTDLRTMRRPAVTVQRVMEAVCVAFGVPADWQSGVRLLEDPKFASNVANFARDAVPEVVFRKLMTYTETPDYDPDQIGKRSAAAQALCLWTRALVNYAKASRSVEPQRQKIAKMRADLKERQARASERRGRLAQSTEDQAQLQREYNDKLKAVDVLKVKYDELLARREQGAAVIAGFAGEYSRWMETVHLLKKEESTVVGDTVVAAAWIAYAGALTQEYRRLLVAEIRGLCEQEGLACSMDVTVPTLVADPNDMASWRQSGLGATETAAENATLVTRSLRWPLLVDPQLEGARWITRLESPNGLRTLKCSDAGFLRALESAVRLGQPVLLMDIPEGGVDPAIMPLLRRQIYRQHGRVLVRWGETSVDFDPNFRLYACVRRANPRLSMDFWQAFNVVSFRESPEWIEDAMLSAVFGHFARDDEDRLSELVVDTARFRTELDRVEALVLERLCAGTGSAIEDDALMAELGVAQKQADAAHAQMENANNERAAIAARREKFRPLAASGAHMYLATDEFVRLNPLLQFSVPDFVNLYALALRKCVAGARDDGSVDVDALLKVVPAQLFQHVSRALPEDESRAFAIIFCGRILRARGAISDTDWRVLLATHRPSGVCPPRPDVDWLTPEAWEAAIGLGQAVPAYERLCADLSARTRVWQAFGESKVPHREPLPDPWAAELNDIQRLIVTKTLRPDMAVPAVLDWVERAIGEGFAPRAFDRFRGIFQETSPSTPLLLILGEGADPADELLAFAAEQGKAARMHVLALGEGAYEGAEALLDKAAKTGDWVFLQNCHLAGSWMARLEEIVTTLSGAETPVHHDFRLFLSSEPSPDFPITLLQQCVKMTSQPATGIRARLSRAIVNYERPPAALAGNTEAVTAWRRLTFAVAMMHVVLTERVRFGVGTSISRILAFSDKDLVMLGVAVNAAAVRAAPLASQLRYLRHAFAEVIYGGRLADQRDRLLLSQFADSFLCEGALSAGHAFSEAYRTPEGSTYADFARYVDSLGATTDIGIFRVDPAEAIASNARAGRRLLRMALSLQPWHVIGTRAAVAERLALERAHAVLSALPPFIETENASEMALPKDGKGRLTPLSAFVLREGLRYNALITRLKTGCDAVIRAATGGSLLTTQVQRLFDALAADQAPAEWRFGFVPTNSALIAFLEDLNKRVAFVRDWIAKGPPPTVWLPAFFSPRAFLATVLQAHAVKTSTPVDRLTFSHRVDKSPLKPLADGSVAVSGLYLEGADFDDNTLKLVDTHVAHGSQAQMLPAIRFTPTTDAAAKTLSYCCPMYAMSSACVESGARSSDERLSSTICDVWLPSDHGAVHWLPRGVALVCRPADHVQPRAAAAAAQAAAPVRATSRAGLEGHRDSPISDGLATSAIPESQ